MFPQRNDLSGFMDAYVNGFLQIIQSPIAQEAMVNILKQLDPPQQAKSPKDHLAVAQDALEAYRNGSLTRDQAMQIVLICLQDDARAKGQVIDITAKRNELARLFS